MIKIILLVICAALVTFNATAANRQTAYMSIEMVRASQETGTAYVKPVGSIEIKNTSCSSTDLYAISMSDSHFPTLYSTLLAAAASKRQIRLWISDLPEDCLVSRQRIRVVDVKY
jgi:predicted nucleic acid-binding protein